MDNDHKLPLPDTLSPSPFAPSECSLGSPLKAFEGYATRVIQSFPDQAVEEATIYREAMELGMDLLSRWPKGGS